MRRGVLGMVALVLLAAACGGDEGGGGQTPAEKKKKDEMEKKKKAAAAKNKQKKKKLDVITHIPVLEQKVACRQGTLLRHKLKDRDFAAVDNRNPFYSAFLPPPEGETATTVGPGTVTGPVPVVKATRECDAKDMVLTDYALRDLKLTGIVRKGNQRIAMFSPPKGMADFVRRGNCLGREKARVMEIAEELVSLEITPEEGTTPVTPGTENLPQQITIPLYPESIVSEDVEDVTATPEPEPTDTSGMEPAPPPPSP